MIEKVSGWTGNTLFKKMKAHESHSIFFRIYFCCAVVFMYGITAHNLFSEVI